MKKLRELGADRGLRGEKEIVEQIFASGVSTSDEVNTVSGRGVGMDAVKMALKGLDASIEIEFLAEDGEGYRLFEYVIEAPLATVVHPVNLKSRN